MLETKSNTLVTKSDGGTEFSVSYPNLAFSLVADLRGMEALEPAWRALENQTPQAFTYFQTYDWCHQWMKTFGSVDDKDSKPQPRIFTASEHGKPVLIWPLMVEQGPMGLNTLTWLSWPHAQYGNVLAEAGERADAAIKACWDHIQRLPRIDSIELPGIPALCPLASVLFDEDEHGDSTNQSSIMDLTRFEKPEDLTASWSKSARRSRGRRYRKLAANGDLKFSVHDGGTPEYRKAVTDALRMKDDWLTNTGKVSRALSMPGNEDFLANLPVSPGEGGRALAGVLSLDGEAVAVEIGFERGGDYLSYLGAYEWQLRGYSPGKIEMDLMLRWAIEKDLKSYDLLANASSYKDDWSNLEVPLLNRVVAQSVLGAARTELWVKRLRPALKNTLEGLPDTKRRMLFSALSTKPTQNPSAQ